MGNMEKEKILSIENLQVSFDTYAGEIRAIRDVNIDLYKGEVVAIVGESGCGKSVTFQSTMQLLPIPPAVYKGGSIMYDGRDILKLSRKEMEHIRGSEISMILQDPMTSLDPTMQIGKQITEGLLRHEKMSSQEAFKKSVEMLELVGIPNPERRMKQYPHEFSGGMRQRVCIAIALVCNPKILIADEPTTALDVTIQAQILDLLKGLKDKLGTAIVLITHDLGIVVDMASRVVVMYAGKVVEEGSIDDIFYDSWHPYTWGLLKSMPKLTEKNKTLLSTIDGTPPDLYAPPVGCAFAPRCEYAMKVCYDEQPKFYDCGQGHITSCWLKDSGAPAVVRPISKGGEV